MLVIFFLILGFVDALPTTITDTFTNDLIDLPCMHLSNIVPHMTNERDLSNNFTTEHYLKQLQLVSEECYTSTLLLLRNDIKYIFGYQEVLIWDYQCINALYQLSTTYPIATSLLELKKIRIVLHLDSHLLKDEILKMLTQLQAIQNLKTFKAITLSLELADDASSSEIIINAQVLFSMNQLGMRLDRVLDPSGFLLEAITSYDIVEEYETLNCTASAILHFPTSLKSVICLDFDSSIPNIPKLITLPFITSIQTFMETIDQVSDLAVIFDLNFDTHALLDHLYQFKEEILPRVNHISMPFLNIETMNVIKLS